jgi:hypothetical protein
MIALKYIIDFVKIFHLKLLYLIFENEIDFIILNFKISKVLFTHFCNVIAFHFH